jgi:D-glycero-alpha-D-manno-heptose 1-phosphate guanylyltransferase
MRLIFNSFFQYAPIAEGGFGSEAIILAGGLGTRLRSAVPDLPKCMAPVNDKPFLSYVINYLQTQKVERFIFSVGYMHEEITKYLALHYPRLNAEIVVEEEPLGTGGAIRLSCDKATTENVIVTNGDTLFRVDCRKLLDFHKLNDGDCTLSLKRMIDFDRYGVVELDKDNAVKSFREKQFYKEGLINGGLYAINVKSFLGEDLPEKFSFEKDYLEKLFTERKMFGLVQDEYFIDIGIPDDYERAQTELKELQ